jgi:hypothetical protein
LGSFIPTELPIELFSLLLHGQGLIDEGLMRPFQDLLHLLQIIAGLHRLEKPVDDGDEGLAPSRNTRSVSQVLYTLQQRMR